MDVSGVVARPRGGGPGAHGSAVAAVIGVDPVTGLRFSSAGTSSCVARRREGRASSRGVALLLVDARPAPVVKSSSDLVGPSDRVAAHPPTRRPLGPTRGSTGQHKASPEPWTLQRNRIRSTTARHAFLRFPEPGVAGSIPAGGTRSSCIWHHTEPPSAHDCPVCCQMPTFCRQDAHSRHGTGEHADHVHSGRPSSARW